MNSNNDSVPQFVADGVEQEAIVFTKNREFYQRAVLPYAEKVYVMQQLINQLEQELKYTKDALAGSVKLLDTALTTIKNIVDKV